MSIPANMRTALLLVAGVVALAIGAGALFAPAFFHALNGIDLGTNRSLLSEVRGAGGAILATGTLLTVGAFVRRLERLSAFVGALMYLSYAASRVLGITLDGPPASGLLIATGAEIVLGLACVAVLHGDAGRPQSHAAS
jgi:hypothetical protein